MLEDSDLAARAIENPDEYAPLVEKYEQPLLRYILRISNISQEEGEDLLQNVFLKAYQNLNDFDGKLKFSSWIYRIAHNEVVSAWRRRSARAGEINLEKAEAAKILCSTLDVPVRTDEKFLTESVREMLGKLPQKYREVLILRFLEEKDYSEISDILHKPPGTVATLLNRAKRAFEQAAREANLEKFLR
ncbi:MAG: sigma-70 family RNA polymerase sigma factor [Patescibacteria group bacterium]